LTLPAALPPPPPPTGLPLSFDTGVVFWSVEEAGAVAAPLEELPPPSFV